MNTLNRLLLWMPLVLIAISGACVAQRTIYVDASASRCPGSGTPPDPYCKISDGIIAAGNGDTVLVRPGTYRENLDFQGKIIRVVSEQGANRTTIDGGRRGSVVVFRNAEGRPSVLSGFTLVNGTGTSAGSYVAGGGVCCLAASPTISHNVITGCSAMVGGGIYCGNGSAPLVQNNAILGNNAAGVNQLGCGGGIACVHGSPEIVDNRVDGNTGNCGGAGVLCFGSNAVIAGNEICRQSSPRYGGVGLIVTSLSSPIVVNNTFWGNTGAHGGGMQVYGDASATVVNCTFAGNTSSGSPGSGVHLRNGASILLVNTIIWGNVNGQGELALESNSSATVVHCDIGGGWPGTGNIDADPAFVDAKAADFHLGARSPCRDQGLNNAPAARPFDFEGDPRVANGTADMGADEFFPHLYHTGNPTPGGSIQVEFIGQPSDPVVLAVGTGILNSALKIPGLEGVLYLPPSGLLPMPVGYVPASGMLRFPVSFPPNFPKMSIPTQALIALRLSNLETVDVR